MRAAVSRTVLRSTAASILLACAALAHEPFLLLSDNHDGNFTAEAGFSDQSSPEGLRLLIRDRATSQVLSEHALPANGKMILPMPAVPYRVSFEGGPGHRVSKAGPFPAPATPTPAESKSSPAPNALPAPSPSAETSQPNPPASARETLSSATVTHTQTSPQSPADERVVRTEYDDTLKIAWVVGIFFLFGALAFGLGYLAGRRPR